MRKTRDFLVNISLLIAVVIIFLLTFEVVLRLTSAKPVSEFNRIVETNDSRNYKNMPNYGYVENGISYRMNDDGLRDDKNYSENKSTFRIALLGDSVTFGLNVDLNETFGKLIEKELKIEVLNFGVQGYDTLSEIETLKAQALKYNPDLILLNFIMNDIEPSGIPFKGIEQKECILPIIKVKVSCEVKTALRNIKVVDFFYNKLNALFYSKVRDYYAVSWADEELYQNNIVQPLKEFKQICKDGNLQCAVIIFPLFRFNSTYYQWEAQENELIRDLSKLSINYLLLRETFQNYTSEDVGGTSTDILHPNKLGHEITAEEIARFLKERYIK